LWVIINSYYTAFEVKTKSIKSSKPRTDEKDLLDEEIEMQKNKPKNKFSTVSSMKRFNAQSRNLICCCLPKKKFEQGKNNSKNTL